jgi:hypothetical protein
MTSIIRWSRFAGNAVSRTGELRSQEHTARGYSPAIQEQRVGCRREHLQRHRPVSLDSSPLTAIPEAIGAVTCARRARADCSLPIFANWSALTAAVRRCDPAPCCPPVGCTAGGHPCRVRTACHCRAGRCSRCAPWGPSVVYDALPFGAFGSRGAGWSLERAFLWATCRLWHVVQYFWPFGSPDSMGRNLHLGQDLLDRLTAHEPLNPFLLLGTLSDCTTDSALPVLGYSWASPRTVETSPRRK